MLDTHIFVWLVNNDSKISDIYTKLVEKERSKSVSVVSLWEISLLMKKGRISLRYSFDEWVNNSLKAFGIEIIKLDMEIVLIYHKFINFHNDPADKLIAATSIS